MVQDFTWTAPLDQIDFRPDVLSYVDAIEIAGCVDDGMATERVENGGDFFSVYFHRRGEDASCIADRNTWQEALDYASAWGIALGVPAYIFGSEF